MFDPSVEPSEPRASTRTVTGDVLGLKNPTLARNPPAAEVFDTCGITPRRSALARLKPGTNWPKLPLFVFTKMRDVATIGAALEIRSAPIPVVFSPDVPAMSLSTAVPRAARLIAIEAAALVLAVVPAVKNSTRAVVGVSNDGLKPLTSLMKV